jgi:hypothetical protein
MFTFPMAQFQGGITASWATWDGTKDGSAVASAGAPDSSNTVSCSLSSTSVLVFYVDNTTGYGYAIVGTTSGDTISWGTPAAVTGTNSPTNCSIVALTSSQAIVGYSDNSSGSTYAMVINVVATVPSGGTRHQVGAGTSGSFTAIGMISSTQAILAYVDSSTLHNVVSLTVSASVISVGAIVQFNLGTSGAVSITGISSTSALMFYIDSNNSNKPTSMIISISGTTLSTNTAYVVDTVNAASEVCFVSQMSTISFGVVYADSNTYAAALSVAGTIITAGTPVTVSTVSGSIQKTASCVADSTHLMFMYIDGSGNLQGLTGTVSSTTITLNSVVEVAAATEKNPYICNLDTQHIAAVYNTATPLLYGKVVSIV